jgi:hypothetical protein
MPWRAQRTRASLLLRAAPGTARGGDASGYWGVDHRRSRRRALPRRALARITGTVPSLLAARLAGTGVLRASQWWFTTN